MKEIEVHNFAELHNAVFTTEPGVHIFRGVSSSSFKLIPKVGRYEHIKSISRLENEKRMFSIYKERVMGMPGFKNLNEFELLANGQHHGLPTRLMDWTRNPLVAAFFCIGDEYKKENGAIYSFPYQNLLDVNQYQDPFSVKGVNVYSPAHITERITAQNGLFTLHSNPTSEFSHANLTRIIIPFNFKRSLKLILYKYGIHEASLFPDLGGIANFIEWLCTKKMHT